MCPCRALERLGSSGLPASSRHLAQVLFAEVQPSPPNPAFQLSPAEVSAVGVAFQPTC